MITANFRTLVLFAQLAFVFTVKNSFAQQGAAFQRPYWFGKTSRDGKYVVWEGRVRYMDSIYTARGYNDERHMKVIPIRDTAKSLPASTFWQTLDNELRRDGLLFGIPTVGKKTTYNVDPEKGLFYINNIPQSPEVSKKYVKMFVDHDAQRKRDKDPNEAIADERREYLSNLIVFQMLKDKLVKEGETLTYRLDRKEFVVNGKLQTPQIYKKYYDKFIGALPESWPWPGWVLK